MGVADFAVAVVTSGVGFILADGIDRLLATYNPSSTDPKPTDKFTSDGSGTLANTLNVAMRPNLMRIGAGVGVAAAPALLSAYAVRNRTGKAALDGLALGAGVNLFRMFWNNFLMPMLTPKDTSPPSLQKSIIVRLYPAEVAASLNMQQKQVTAVAGVLSGADVGPFALAAESPYPDAGQALRNATGIQDSQYPTVQNTWGTGGPGSDYPTVAQSMGTGAPYGRGNPGQPGVSQDWQPGPPSDVGPGPQARPHSDPSCGCVGDPLAGHSAFLGESREELPYLPGT